MVGVNMNHFGAQAHIDIQNKVDNTVVFQLVSGATFAT